MSLLKTKPNWFKGECIATHRGWVNPQSGEVLVAIGNLRLKLEAEYKKSLPLNLEVVSVEKTPEIKYVIKEIVKMEQKSKLPKLKHQKSVLGESTENKIPRGQQLIAEIVEYDIDKTEEDAE